MRGTELMNAWLLLATIAGCGRVGFEPCVGAAATDTPAVPLPAATFSSVFLGGTGTLLSDTIEWHQTAGDLLVMPQWVFDATTTLSASDSLGQTWTAGPIQHTTASDCGTPTQLQIFYTIATTTGPVSVTSSESTAAEGGFFLATYQGVSANAPLDIASGHAATAASNAITSGTFASTSNDLIIALLLDRTGSGTLRTDAPFTVRTVDLTAFIALADNAPGTQPGAQEVTGSLPGGMSNDCWVVQALAFRTR
jgi:hypothetical protein